MGTVEEMGGITDGFKRFLVSKTPSMLCKMARRGELDKIKQIFLYVNQENISVEEMGVKNNRFNQGKKPTLVDINAGYRGRSPLIEAAIFGHHQVCKYLIAELKANLEARDDYQMTALMHAVASNKTEVITVLLQHNASVKAKYPDDRHPAYYAAYNGHLNALKMLVEKDADVIDKGWNGETLLIAASRMSRVDVCKYLVEEKYANVNLKDDDGKTALEHAEDPEIIKSLKKC